AEKKNTDHFYKRGSVKNICLMCAAMALYTLQTSAPFGGAGHRTGLRGGGPLTTIVEGRNLWETIWLNVLEKSKFLELGNSAKNSPEDKFPWLGNLKPASNDEIRTPETVHPSQMFFSVPRRIRLLPVKSTGSTCELCGKEKCTTIVKSYVTENGGINYKGGWRHTLSPYYADKNTSELHPVHAQAGSLAYNNLSGILFKNPNSLTIPAITIQEFVLSRYEEIWEIFGKVVPLWVSGYDMDKAKARGYYDFHMPMFHVKPEILEDYSTLIQQLIMSADFALFNIRRCIRKSIFDERNKTGGDLSYINTHFWHDTEQDFYRIISSALSVESDNYKTIPLREEWIKILAREGMMLFDRYSQADMIGYANPKRIALARKDCRLSLSGTNRKICELLNLPKPDLKEGKDIKMKALKSSKAAVLEEY
ncbi:MAG: type I-E CRISPR-associated protein Cse1/CasA, partial [Methanomicrobiales archaeon]|nr:type I-E CRISPR-associated protein Cse1/CasA [Methanomicrobiales archaeon]